MGNVTGAGGSNQSQQQLQKYMMSFAMNVLGMGMAVAQQSAKAVEKQMGEHKKEMDRIQQESMTG